MGIECSCAAMPKGRMIVLSYKSGWVNKIKYVMCNKYFFIGVSNILLFNGAVYVRCSYS